MLMRHRFVLAVLVEIYQPTVMFVAKTIAAILFILGYICCLSLHCYMDVSARDDWKESSSN